MSRYVLRRAAHAIPVLVGITAVSFLLIHLVPGDPVRIMMGQKAPEDVVIAMRHQLGLDRPLLRQYIVFLTGAAHGDLGNSVLLQQPVSQVIGERIQPSLFLIGYATLISLALAVPLGVLSAIRRNRPLDHAIRLVTIIAFAMPSFWLGLILAQRLSLQLGIFPVSGYGTGLFGHLRSMTLPAFTLGLLLMSLITRSLRASLIDVLSTEYVDAARARGVPESRIVMKHAIRNSLTAPLTVLAVNIGALIGGSVIIERVFDIPGLGQLLVSSILTRDFPVVAGLTLVFGVMVIAISLLADVAYAAIDPRVRLE